jgi:hypothetical protein
VTIGLEDEAGWVEQQIAAAVAALGEPSGRIEGAQVIAGWQALADAAAVPGDGSGGDAVALEFATAANTPAALAPVIASAAPALTSAGAPFVFHAPAGRLHVSVAADRAQALVVKLADEGFVLIGARGADVTPALPPQQAVRDLRARLRAALDPAGALAMGGRWA